MSRILPRYSMIFTLLCLPMFAAFAIKANAQIVAVSPDLTRSDPGGVPTKTLTIYNNSRTDTVYPVLTGFIGDVDLWLQAQFNILPGDSNTRTFCNSFPNPGVNNNCPTGGKPTGKPSALFRAYINLDKGILPQQSVTIDVPFYTQLKPTTSADLGLISAQFIDWWNAERVFLYNGKTAITGAYYYNVDENGKIDSPPPVVSVLIGAAVPSCDTGNRFNCETPVVVRYVSIYPTGSIPFQLAEYTFGSAVGPPPGGLLLPGEDFKIDLDRTNFNVSAVDGIYLPVAMAAVLQDDPVAADSQYLGTTEQYTDFRNHLETFSKKGANWPYYWPSYFSPMNPTTALPDPPDDFEPYALPSIPSAYVLIAESYKVPPPAPPVISSNTPDNKTNPDLGKAGAALVKLWNTCTNSSDDKSTTCQEIRKVRDFFLTDYNDTCGFPGSPTTTVMLSQVYGWAQFPNCSKDLASSPGYQEAIETYCGLQYNYLTGTPRDYIFNAYNELVHKTLKSNAYGFSIDDKAAFKGVPSEGKGTSPGLIVTIGGSKGLPAPNDQVPLPDTNNFHQYCH